MNPTQSKCKAKLLLVSKETTPFNSCSPDITQVRCGSSFSCLYTICNMHKLINNHAETPSCNKDYSDNNKPFKTNYCSKILYQNTLSYWLRSQMSMSNGLWLSGNIDVIKVATVSVPVPVPVPVRAYVRPSVCTAQFSRYLDENFMEGVFQYYLEVLFLVF